MKSLFVDNRPAEILQYLRSHTGVRISTLAAKMSVSDRTVRNDIKQLNKDLAPCAAMTYTPMWSRWQPVWKQEVNHIKKGEKNGYYCKTCSGIYEFIYTGW